MAAYLDAWLEEAPEDAAGIARALGDIARAKGMTQVARDAGVSRGQQVMTSVRTRRYFPALTTAPESGVSSVQRTELPVVRHQHMLRTRASSDFAARPPAALACFMPAITCWLRIIVVLSRAPSGRAAVCLASKRIVGGPRHRQFVRLCEAAFSPYAADHLTVVVRQRLANDENGEAVPGPQ